MSVDRYTGPKRIIVTRNTFLRASMGAVGSVFLAGCADKDGNLKPLGFDFSVAARGSVDVVPRPAQLTTATAVGASTATVTPELATATATVTSVVTSTPTAVVATKVDTVTSTSTATVAAKPVDTVTSTATVTAVAPTKLPVLPTNTPVLEAVAKCFDGENVFTFAAPKFQVLPRVPMGEAERADIVEVGVPGKGFGGFDRFILEIPRKGNVWQPNLQEGALTAHEIGFCGQDDAVTDWAIKTIVASLQHASRDPQGNQPDAGEITVVRLRFEDATLQEVKPGSLKAEDIASRWLDVSFRENGKTSAVRLKAIR